jgi:predicted nucleotidyltransferase component of viral defense system
MIPQRAISLISNGHQSASGRRIPEAVIERDYCLAWFLTGLAGHSLREALAFKGGTALRRCWFTDYRFSEDLDFTLMTPLPFTAIRAGLDEIFASVETSCGLRMAFDHEDRHGHQNSHTFYLSYQGPLPSAGDVKVDITINEVLSFPLVERPILRTYESFADLPDGQTIRVYALEEIIVEKLVALTDRARTEPRDLYDLEHLLDNTRIDLADLQLALKTKLAFRNRSLAGIEATLAAKEQRLAKLWSTRLSHQMSSLPPFESIFRQIQRALHNAKFPDQE